MTAAHIAWVFGAMGSWNDQSFEHDVNGEYESVPAVLYAAVLAAARVATNLSDRAS